MIFREQRSVPLGLSFAECAPKWLRAAKSPRVLPNRSISTNANLARLEHIHKLFNGLEKVRVEAFADFFLRLD
jgi:hypothetical protein